MKKSSILSSVSAAGLAAVLSVSLAASPVFAQTQKAPEVQPSAALRAMPSPTLITLSLKAPKFSDVVKILGEKYEIPILTDSFLQEMDVSEITLDAVPSDKALQIIAEKFSRKLEWVGPVAVLRHRQWFAQPLRDKQYAKYLGANTPPPAPADVRAVDPEGETRPMGLPPRRPSYALPPSHVSLTARGSSVGNTLEKFSAASQCVTTTSAPFAERRVNVYIKSVTPDDFLAALTFLLDASQSVTLGEGAAQAERAKLLAEEAADHRRPDMKLSDELKSKLVKLLKPDQRAALGQDDIPLPLSSLPASLQDMALKYIQMRVDLLGRSGIDGIDASQFRNFSLVLLPPPSTGIGVNGTFKNGGVVHF